MKKVILTIMVTIACTEYTLCQQTGSKRNNTAADKGKDNRLNNVTTAKPPKGKMSYRINGQLTTIPENKVQCMYVGMNSTMAQSVISGGNQFIIIHMGIPKVGEVEIYSTAGMPSVSMSITVNGLQYTNKKKEDATLTLTKVTPDGKNYYVAGRFSGTFTSADGKKITVTDGVFESAYVN